MIWAHAWKKFFWLAIIVLVGLFVFTLMVGCSSAPKRSRGSLSDAMEQASDDNDGDRRAKKDTKKKTRRPREHDHDHDDGVTVVVVVDDDDDVSSYTPESNDDVDTASVQIGVVVGTGVLKGDDYYATQRYGISIGAFASPRVEGEVRAAYARAPIQETSDLSESIDGGVEFLELAVAGKFYLTPRHTFLGPYLVAGFGWTAMFWEFKNPIISEGEEIESDWLTGPHIYAGIGLNLIQAKIMRIGLEITPGFNLWRSVTEEGFDNDVFGTFSYVRFNIRTTFNLGGG